MEGPGDVSRTRYLELVKDLVWRRGGIFYAPELVCVASVDGRQQEEVGRSGGSKHLVWISRI